MSVIIKNVIKKSLADKKGMLSGDLLLEINKTEITDLLDYRFCEVEKTLHISFERDNVKKSIVIHKEQYEEIGLEFETFLMDNERHCKNKCMFCFIDQLPKGLRETLYFKDDDFRLGFLYGNYITMTNLSDNELDRILKYKISPVNVSVHTMSPELRVKMLHNPSANQIERQLGKLANGGTLLNCQIVLCKNVNDGNELDNTIKALMKLYPSVQSVSIVPAGYTKHRKNLCVLQPFNKEECAEIIKQIEAFADMCKTKYDDRIFYIADEFYISAGVEIPSLEHYGELHQIENGVGMTAQFKSEFYNALSELKSEDLEKCNLLRLPIGVITGVISAPILQNLVDDLVKKCDNINCIIYPIKNLLFGENITVSGLISAGDIISAFKDQIPPRKLLIPMSMLKNNTDLFLDNLTVSDLETKLGVKVQVIPVDGEAFLEALIN